MAPAIISNLFAFNNIQMIYLLYLFLQQKWKAQSVEVANSANEKSKPFFCK